MRRQVEFIFAQYGQSVFARRRIGNRRARGDDCRIIARHIGDDERDNLRREGCRREPPALESREMLAHAVHFRYRRAAAEKLAVHILLVFKRQAGRRGREERRSPARDQAENQVIFTQALDQFAHPQCRVAAIGVRHGMCGFDDLDALAGYAMTVAGDHKARKLALPVLLDRQRHCGTRLAGTDNDGAPSRC